jgi:hypothetical protein
MPATGRPGERATATLKIWRILTQAALRPAARHDHRAIRALQPVEGQQGSTLETAEC